MTSEPILTSCALLLYAGVAMVLAPLGLARRRWTNDLPRTAIVMWLTALTTGTAAALIGVGYAIHAARTLAAEASRSLSSGSIVNGLTLTLLACLAMSLTGGLAGTAVYRVGVNAVHRRRVRRTFTSLRERSTDTLGRDTHVVESREANAISVAGRKPQIVISSLLRDHLDPWELEVVIEHERAHLAQHHHALLHLADVQYRCAPALPCARALDQSLHLLVELAADDHAARRCGISVTASVLRSLGEMSNDESYTLRARRLEDRHSRRLALH